MADNSSLPQAGSEIPCSRHAFDVPLRWDGGCVFGRGAELLPVSGVAS
jgi:hypothetical protein